MRIYLKQECIFVGGIERGLERYGPSVVGLRGDVVADVGSARIQQHVTIGRNDARVVG